MIITDDSISIRHFAVSGEKKRFFQLCLKIPILTSVTSLPLTTQHAPASTEFELICPPFGILRHPSRFNVFVVAGPLRMQGAMALKQTWHGP